MKWFILFILLQTNLLFGQCLNATLIVSGPGCGCLSGCNLTSIGGTNCGSGTTGDCNGGQLAMYNEVIVPISCTFTCTAEFKKRTGCGSSGMDSGDKLKVDRKSGSKVFTTGASNADRLDAITVTGPDTIVISGSSNRADEIITYTIVDNGTCPSCNALSIDLMEFSGENFGEYNEIKWRVDNWIDFLEFVLERSEDMVNWNSISRIDFYGRDYTIRDYIKSDLFYYRLKMVDKSGDFKYSENIAIRQRKVNKSILHILNLQGQSVKDTSGVRIIIYEDGTYLKKIYN